MKALLLLSVCWFLCEAQNPKIKMVPKYGLLYAGDTVSLKCSGVPSRWLFNGERMNNTDQILTLPAVSKDDSGHYQCVTTAGTSDKLNITVLEYLPLAFLTVLSEDSVVYNNKSVLLKLSVDEDLKDWLCFVVRKYLPYHVMIPRDKMDGQSSVEFYVGSQGGDPEIVFCKLNRTTTRSNSVRLRSSDKEVLLEAPLEPVVKGEPLTLRCVVRGGAAIKKAVFYKNGKVVKSTSDGSYTIQAVTDRDSYRCQADYQYTYVKPHGALKKDVFSDPQTITIRARPPTPFIVSNNKSLECSCPDCPKYPRFNWYYRKSSTTSKGFYLHTKGQQILYHYDAGEYVCRASWEYGASGLSQPKNTDNSPPSNVLWMVFFGLALVGLLLVIVLLWLKKRGENSAEQGDMPMRSVRRKAGEGGGDDAADDAYQPLKGQDKSEYQTLPAKQGHGEGEGGYESVGAARAGPGASRAGDDGADGGYEALKVKGDSDVYHSLQPTTSQGAEGGYEPLKGNRQKDTYETLKTGVKGAVGGDYEDVKGAEAGASDEKSENAGLYQSLGANDGDGGYEELRAKKKNNDLGNNGEGNTTK